MAAAFAGRVDIMQTLLDAGAEVERKDQVFKTAMIYAAAQGHAEAVKLLLARGVDVNRAYAHNLTALMWAAGYGKTECVQLLLASGSGSEAQGRSWQNRSRHRAGARVWGGGGVAENLAGCFPDSADASSGLLAATLAQGKRD